MTPIPIVKSKLGPNGLEYVEKYMHLDSRFTSLEAQQEWEERVGVKLQSIEHVPDHLFPNAMAKLGLGFEQFIPQTREEVEMIRGDAMCKHDLDASQETMFLCKCGGMHDLSEITNDGMPQVLIDHRDDPMFEQFDDHEHTGGHCHHPSHNGTHLHPDLDEMLALFHDAHPQIQEHVAGAEERMIIARAEAQAVKLQLKAEKAKTVQQTKALALKDKTIADLTKAVEGKEKGLKAEKAKGQK